MMLSGCRETCTGPPVDHCVNGKTMCKCGVKSQSERISEIIFRKFGNSGSSPTLVSFMPTQDTARFRSRPFLSALLYGTAASIAKTIKERGEATGLLKVQLSLFVFHPSISLI